MKPLSRAKLIPAAILVGFLSIGSYYVTMGLYDKKLPQQIGHQFISDLPLLWLLKSTAVYQKQRLMNKFIEYNLENLRAQSTPSKPCSSPQNTTSTHKPSKRPLRSRPPSIDSHTHITQPFLERPHVSCYLHISVSSHHFSSLSQSTADCLAYVDWYMMMYSMLRLCLCWMLVSWSLLSLMAWLMVIVMPLNVRQFGVL